MEKVIPSQVPIEPLQKDLKLSKWYQNIYELPLRRFEDVLLNNNLSALIISGFPEQSEINKAWDVIISEYSECLGTAEHEMYVNLYRETELLKGNLELIIICIETLRREYSKYLADTLNGLLRTTCKFNIKDPATYLSELDKCERRSKGLKINLELKLIEFEAVKKKVAGSKTDKIDKNYFTSVLIMLSKHNGYSITKDIFVNEYCEFVKQFNSYMKELEKK